jgi:hypothetical protein
MEVETSKQPVAFATTMGFWVAINICLAMIGSVHPAQRRWPSVNLVSCLESSFNDALKSAPP